MMKIVFLSFIALDIYGTEIRMLLPEGLRKVLAVSTSVKSLLRIEGRHRNSLVYSVISF